MKKILIGKPYVKLEEENDVKYCLLCSDVTIEDRTKSFNFRFDFSLHDYLVTENIDPFVVAFLPYCFINGYDIQSDYPIDEKLKNQLNEYLLPAISKIKGFYQVKIICPVSNISFNGKHVATGVSCGVDSLYTIFKNLNTHSIESNLNLDYLCFFYTTTGVCQNGNIWKQELALGRSINASKFAKEISLKYIFADTSFNYLYKTDEHEKTHVFRTLSFALALQKLFRTYYFSSGFTYDSFSLDSSDPAFYDILIMPNISTKSLSFISVGGETNRLGKIKYISNFPLSYKYLNVCLHEVNNCNICGKCRRTMLELYVIDKLEKYKDVFDIQYFYNHKSEYIKFALYFKKCTDFNDVYLLLKEKQEIKIIYYIEVFFMKIFIFIKKNIKNCKIRKINK